jgi:MOB kinase activator 1
MFRLFGNGNKNSTFKPVKSHKNAKRENLHDLTMRTLGSGLMRATVALPHGEDLQEWIAVNVVDFFNEVSLIWGIVLETELPSYKAGEGFPVGFEYLWADGVVIKKPIRCSSTEYVDYVMSWIEDKINDEGIFPVSESTPFPKNYGAITKQIFTRMFRIFAIIYTQHFSRVEQLGAAAHLNTSFKHLMYFIWEFDLIDQRELPAMSDIVKALREKYNEEA